MKLSEKESPAQRWLATPQQPALGAETRPGTLPADLVEQEVVSTLSERKLPQKNQDLIRALVLLWHDHLDAAHSLAQPYEDEDGSYVHGLVHRREPDYWNAKYWFRRAGRHRIHPTLACKAWGLLEAAAAAELKAQLLPGGEWDPFAFVDACEKVARASAGHVALLRAIQAAEFELLLNYLLGASQ